MTNRFFQIFLLAAIMGAMPLTVSRAADEAQTYEASRNRNHAHVGIHQRREAFRGYLASGAPEKKNINEIEPAAGDTQTEKSSSLQQENADPSGTRTRSAYND